MNKQTATKRTDDFVYLHPLTLKQELLALAGLFLILCVFRFRVFPVYSSAYLGGFERDAGLYIWLVKSNLSDLFSFPWFDTRAFFPYTQTLAWSDNFILPSLFCWPLLAIGLTLPAAFNTLILSANLLNGYCTYRLAKRLCGRGVPAFVSGAMFMCYSFLGSHLGHPQLQFVFWLPLTFGLLFRFFARPALLTSLFIGLSVCGTFLTTVYYALFLVIGLACLSLACILLKPMQFKWQDYLKLAAGMLVGFLPCFFFIFPYLSVRETFGARRLFEAYSFSANGLSYLSAPVLNLFYRTTANWSNPEAQLFPGFIVLILAGLAFTRTIETKRLKPFAVGITCLLVATLVSSSATDSQSLKYLCAGSLWLLLACFMFFLINLGRLERSLNFHLLSNRGIIASFLFTAAVYFAISLGPLGRPVFGSYAPGVFSVLYYLLPGMNSLRAISRIGIGCILCLCLAAPFALVLLIEKRKLTTAVCVPILLLALAENYLVRYPVEGEILAPAIVHHLKELADPDDVVVVTPLTSETKADGSVKSWKDFARLNVNYMNWLQPSKLALLNGYSGQRSRIMFEYPRKLSGFPDRRSLNALGLIANLRFVIHASPYDPTFQEKLLLNRASAFSSELTFVKKDALGFYLFEYHPTTEITPEYFLRVPSHPRGQVHLQLMTLSNSPETHVFLNVCIKEHFEKNPYAAIKISNDGKWQNYSLPLPVTPDSVRPLILSFKSKSKALIYLKRRRWQPL